MVKNAAKSLIISLFLIVSISCSINPTFSRKNIEETIEKMCRNEFNIYVTAFLQGETIWIYAPFNNLINKDGTYNKKTQEKIRNIFLSLRRTVLSMDEPPKFFVFVASNIVNTGLDIYQIGFIPDIVKFGLGVISQKEFWERIVYLPIKNTDALGDTKGYHVTMYDITMGDFITYLVIQKINRTFYDKKIKKYVNIRVINGNYTGGKSTIITDIEPINKKVNIPNAFDVAKDAILNYLTIYKEFSPKIYSIEIKDKYTGKSRFYSIKSLLENYRQK